MKKLYLSATVCLLFFNWTGTHQIRANESIKTQDNPDVLGLKRLGWKVVEKKSRIESRAGRKPYQNLKRVVLVVKYRLRKDKELYFCLVEYDSQLETLREFCADNEEQTEERLERKFSI